jgi:hypothetical protein
MAVRLWHVAPAAPFLLDLWPSVRHSYGCSPFSSCGLLLLATSSFTLLGEGEQPVETLHLEQFNFAIVGLLGKDSPANPCREQVIGERCSPLSGFFKR